MASKSPRALVSNLYASLGRRLGKGLLDDMVRTKNLKPTWTVSKVVAFLMALAIYALIVWLAVTGIIGLVTTFPNPVGIIINLILVLLAFMARPRLPRFPKEYATAQDYPRFFALTEKVARTLHTRNIDAVIFDWDFNASFGQYGVRRRSVLTMGIPLYVALLPRERIALLSHELAHGVNGDPNRGFFVHTALHSLAIWHATLRGDEVVVYSISGTISNAILRVLSGVPWVLFSLMAHLVWRDSQRAEYLADYLAAQTGGTSAQVALLQKTRHAGRYYQMAREIALQNNERDLYAELAHYVAAIPQTDQPPTTDPLEEYELDASHPPDAYRIEFLRAHPIAEPQLTISQEEWDAVDEELAPVRRELQEKLVERYKSTLYY
jgi:Zn-dependent protease with chaperone function